MFDRIVSQVLGRTAQDLLDAMNNVQPIIPSTLMVFI
jgi:hypothetical protein